MPQLRVILFVDIFPPSMGGGATRALRIVQGMVALGWDITVITTSCNYPVGKSILALNYTEEQKDGFNVIRVPSLNLPFKGLLNRLLNYSVSGFSLLTIVPKLKKVDLVFSIGMHPFTDFAAYLAKINNPGSRIIVDISDLFPEESLFRAGGQILNRFLLSLSDSITLHNERMKKVFKVKYAYTKQIVILHNAVDTQVFKPNLSSQRKKGVLSALCGRDLSKSLVLCYFGVLGPYQGLSKIVTAAKGLQNELDDVVFAIIGDGEEKLQLQHLASGLKNLYLFPKMPREKIVQIAAEVDVGLVPLISSDPMVVYVNLPSKAAEFLSSGVPILVAKGTFIGWLASQWSAGYEVDFSNTVNIINALKHIHDNKSELVNQSLSARSLALNVFSLEHIQKSLKTLS